MRGRPTYLELNLLLRYDEGLLYWRERPDYFFKSLGRAKSWNSRYAGKEAFTTTSKGYLSGRIFDVGYLAHRVIFCLTRGYWPTLEIDHIDGNPSNNNKMNLREVSSSENSKNVAIHKSNTSGVCGVYWESYTSRWCSSIESRGVRYKKRFISFNEAVLYRLNMEGKLAFHKNHGRG